MAGRELNCSQAAVAVLTNQALLTAHCRRMPHV